MTPAASTRPRWTRSPATSPTSFAPSPGRARRRSPPDDAGGGGRDDRPRRRSDRAAGGAPSLIALFDGRPARLPERVALFDADESLTYAALDERAARIAAALIARGVKPGAVVALLSGRSLDATAALLGIWKAGAAFLALDPGHPPARLAFMLADSGAAVMLHAGPVAEALAASATPRLALAEALAADRRRRLGPGCWRPKASPTSSTPPARPASQGRARPSSRCPQPLRLDVARDALRGRRGGGSEDRALLRRLHLGDLRPAAEGRAGAGCWTRPRCATCRASSSASPRPASRASCWCRRCSAPCSTFTPTSAPRCPGSPTGSPRARR